MESPAWLGVRRQQGWQRCSSGSAQSFSPKAGGNSYYKMDPFIFTIPFSKDGFCVLKISLQEHFSVNMATPCVEAEIFNSSFTSHAIY